MIQKYLLLITMNYINKFLNMYCDEGEQCIFQEQAERRMIIKAGSKNTNRKKEKIEEIYE